MTGMIDKLLNMLDKYDIKRATELIKKEVFQASEELVYNVESIILPEYQQVNVPLEVEEFLKHLQMIPFEHHDFRWGSSEFCQDSLSYARRQETQANSITYKSYWPSFHSLDDAQEKWYFYWRKEVLSGNYIDTNSGYILIFVYELLNYTFNDNAAFNLSMLDRLYTNYHDKYFDLANYLPQWIADFCYELGEYDLEKKWAAKVHTHEYSDYDNLKRLENKLETVSITFWKRFIRYSKTKFFKANRNLIYKVFKASVSLLRTNYQAQGKNLIDEWMPLNEKAQFERSLFRNAIIGRKVQIKTEVNRRPTLKMREDLTALFRLAENIARMNIGEKRQLSLDEVLFPEGFKNVLIELFVARSESAPFTKGRFIKTRDQGVRGLGSAIPNPPENPDPIVATIPIIEFDLDRIDMLDKESKELLELFALRYDDQEEDEPQDTSDIAEMVNSLETLKSSAKDKDQLPNSPQELSLDEEVESFIAVLNELERDFITGFKNMVRATEEGMQTLKSRDIMMGVFLNTLNEKSLEYLGDNLVEQEGDVLSFNEDFKQVFFTLIKTS